MSINCRESLDIRVNLVIIWIVKCQKLLMEGWFRFPFRTLFRESVNTLNLRPVQILPDGASLSRPVVIEGGLGDT